MEKFAETILDPGIWSSNGPRNCKKFIFICATCHWQTAIQAQLWNLQRTLLIHHWWVEKSSTVKLQCSKSKLSLKGKWASAEELRREVRKWLDSREKVLQRPPSFLKGQLPNPLLLEPSLCLEASMDRHSNGKAPLFLAVKMLWSYRSKGNKWQGSKSQGVEFCASVGEAAYCSLQ